MDDRVDVREVGPRDGLQMVGRMLPTDRKLAWCRGYADAGGRHVEVTSFVPPRIVPQFADAEDVARGVLDIPGLTPAALVPNLKGAQRAMATGLPRVHYVLSASEAHNQKNVRRSTAESVEDFRRIVAARSAEGRVGVKLGAGVATAFGCAIAGEVKASQVLGLVDALLEAGADELTIADTVGYAHPSQVRSLMKQVMARCGGVPVACHFHDTRGLGLANVLAALEAGVRAFDASIGGLGGCPFAPNATGNINTEDTVFLLESEGLDTGIDLHALLALRSAVASWLPGETFVGAVANAGLPLTYKASAQSAADA
jgi:hydroxymethylglutaryl-CoA lyase